MLLRLTKREDSPLWWITGTVAGVSVRESSGTDRRDLAEIKRAARENEIYRAQVHGPVSCLAEMPGRWCCAAKPITSGGTQAPPSEAPGGLCHTVFGSAVPQTRAEFRYRHVVEPAYILFGCRIPSPIPALRIG